MIKLSKENKALLIAAASDLNFYGKRLREKQLAVIENIQANMPDLKSFEVGDLADLVKAEKPEKPKAQKAASNKLDPKVMLGNETRQRDNIEVLEGTKFIVSAAQNNTLPSSVLKQLKTAASELGAKLVIMPMFYNKKAFSATAEDESEYFDPAITPYLVKHDVWLHDEGVVKVCASSAIPLTAKQPINNAQTLNNGELVTIVGHPKQQQRTLLRMAGEPIKTAWTTASCTVFNYLRGRAGSEAENFHAFGGTLVEIIDGNAFCTNLCQSQDGSLMFYDHACELWAYGATDQTKQRPIVTVGDSHFEMFDPECYESVKSVLETTNAKLAVLHDIAHSESRNHHSIINELKFIIERVNEYAEICDIYLVQSNHNAVIDGWLDSQQTANNIMFDTTNSKLFYLMKYLVCEAIDHGENPAGLTLAFSNADLTGLPELASNVRWGAAHIPEIHYNVDYCSHGHKGANGAAKGLTGGKISQSMCLGHTHSPEISYMTSRGGITTQGTTAKMDQGYNRGGGSSWGQASSITHANGITQQYFHAL